jgi:hypothetical protein
MPRRAICAALLLIQLTACMTWRPVRGSLDQPVEPIRNARLTLRNGAELSLHDVTVRSDSVMGLAGDARVRRAFPSADVASIERRELSIARTAAVVGGTAVLAFLVLLGATIAELGGNIGATPAPSVP